MKINFSDLFKEESQKEFHITRTQVKDIINAPHRVNTLELDDLIIGLFLGWKKLPDREIYTLIIAEMKRDSWNVYIAFRIPPELVKSMFIDEPFTVLNEFVQRYGLVIELGTQESKLIVNETLRFKDAKEVDLEITKIRNLEGSEGLQSMFLKVLKENNDFLVHCILVFAINKTSYLQWIRSNIYYQDVDIDIVPILKGQITPYDLIQSVGTITLWSNYSSICNQPGYIFQLLSPMYQFEIGFTSNSFYIERNKQRLEVPFNENNKANENIFFAATWQPRELSIMILDSAYRTAIQNLPETEHVLEIENHKNILKTLPTNPPLSLLDWARRQLIIETVRYDSHQDFFEVVTMMFQLMEDKVSSKDLYSLFWTETYKGKTKIVKRPKPETEVHTVVNGLLSDVATLRNMQVIPEYHTAGGRLDFLVVGQLNDGNYANVCVEFKHAHSDDIEHGLLVQLPQYMKSKGSDFGIYCVLFFKGRFFEKPTRNKEELDFHLNQLRLTSGLQNIRVLIIDLSDGKSPSKA